MAISKVILNGVTQMDVTDTTATAEDVASGKVFYGADGVRTVGTSSGGGGEPVSRSDVNFYDYDGTLLYSYTVSEVNDEEFTLPENPTHEGLIGTQWNWTLSSIRLQLAAMPTQPINVGQQYATDDGTTRLYCRFSEGRLHPYLGICPSGTVTIDWGDGSTTDTLTGTSTYTVLYKDHEYANPGEYIITLSVVEGSFYFRGGTAGSHVLKANTDNIANINRVYNACLYKAELGTKADIGDYGFTYCCNLKTVAHSTTGSLGSYAFRFCANLIAYIVSAACSSIGTYAFSNCYSLNMISLSSMVNTINNYTYQNTPMDTFMIPRGLSTLGNYAFDTNTSLTSIVLPPSLTKIGNSVFNACYALASITIPSTVTSIGTSAFANCYGLGEIHFKPTTPPTVTNRNAWSNLQTDCKIYVPTGTLSAYTSASNYPSSSTYTYIEE